MSGSESGSDSDFVHSFVELTDPTPYHQLIIQSQKMINDAFFNMWTIADADSALHKLNINIDKVGTLEGDLDPPVISLNVTSSDPQLYFLVTFTSDTTGQLTLDTSTTTTKSWDVKGWVFSFSVNIGVNTLKDGDADYDTYTEKMGVTEGSFTLAQLYIDASQASELDSTRSSFGTEDWSKETSAIQQTFKVFITGWLKTMADGDKTVVGVALQTDDPASVNPHAPSFPPTSLDRTMYPWIDPTSPGAPANDLDSNAFCYLMMTGNVTPPSPPSLPYSGTWVNDEDSHQGILCMNASQFWGEWFLPLLQIVNAMTEIYPTTPDVDANADGSFSCTVDYRVGYNPDHPDPNSSYFSFIENSDPDSLTWGWGAHHEADGEGTSDAGAWDNDVKVTEKATSTSAVAFDEGGQKISITGVSTFEYTVNQTGASSGWNPTNASFLITTNWHLNYALGVVSDGGLQISRIPDPKGTDACTSTGTSQTTGFNWTIDWSTITADIAKEINDKFKGNLGADNLGATEDDLANALENQHKLFLPAAGTFLMKDAIFNKRGDLVVTLHYNGDTPPSDSSSSSSRSAEMPEYLSKLPKRLPRRPAVPRKKPASPVSRLALKVYPKEMVPVGGPAPPRSGHA